MSGGPRYRDRGDPGFSRNTNPVGIVYTVGYTAVGLREFIRDRQRRSAPVRVPHDLVRTFESASVAPPSLSDDAFFILHPNELRELRKAGFRFDGE